MLPLPLLHLLLSALGLALGILLGVVDGSEGDLRLASVATLGGLLTDGRVHGRVGSGANLGLEKLLHLVCERLKLGCREGEGISQVPAGGNDRGRLTHLRILSVRVLRDAEDRRSHLDEEALESLLVEVRDDSGEPAEDGGGLKRPLTLRSECKVSSSGETAEQKLLTASTACILGRVMCACLA